MHRDGGRTPKRAACLTAVLAAVMALAAAQPAAAQASPPLLRAGHLDADASVKVFFPSGTIAVEAWDRDSIDVRGTIARGEQFYFAGDVRGVKLGVMDHVDGSPVRSSAIVVRLPRRGQVSVKAVSASIEGRGASGWFYSVSGPIRLTGAASSIEVESMAGDVALDVAAPWVRARTGGGRLAIAGAPEDLDAATVRGTLDIERAAVVRGRFASVDGAIRFAGAPPAGAVYEFSNHAGAVALALPHSASALVDLSTIVGTIDNSFTQVRPVAGQSGRGGTLHLQLGLGEARVTVRTFKGTITLAQQSP